jgi:hypothetical protein
MSATRRCACRRVFPVRSSKCASSTATAFDKDERALAIEREEIERLAKDRDDEQAILDRNVYGRLAEMLIGKTAIGGPKGFKKDTDDRATCSTTSRGRSGGSLPCRTRRHMSEIEALRGQYDDSRSVSSSASSTRSRSCSAVMNCRRAS